MKKPDNVVKRTRREAKLVAIGYALDHKKGWSPHVVDPLELKGDYWWVRVLLRREKCTTINKIVLVPAFKGSDKETRWW